MGHKIDSTEAVRSRLLALAGPESRDKIQRVLTAISEDAEHEAGFQTEHDYAEAHARMLVLKNKGELDETVVFKAAKADRYADIIAALALLCGAQMPLVENLLQSEHREAWVIPCKVAGLDWPTVRVILSCRAMGCVMTDQTLDAARADYYKLSQASAGRVLRFWQVRQTASKDAGPVKISSPAA